MVLAFIALAGKTAELQLLAPSLRRLPSSRQCTHLDLFGTIVRFEDTWACTHNRRPWQLQLMVSVCVPVRQAYVLASRLHQLFRGSYTDDIRGTLLVLRHSITTRPRVIAAGRRCMLITSLRAVCHSGIAFAQRQDESLDSLMLSSSLQPVNDPIPRCVSREQCLRALALALVSHHAQLSKAIAASSTCCSVYSMDQPVWLPRHAPSSLLSDRPPGQLSTMPHARQHRCLLLCTCFAAISCCRDTS